MRWRWAVYIWPGFSQIISRAEVSGLMMAMLFAVGVNLLLAATFVWKQLLPAELLIAFWSILCIFWLVSVVVAARRDWYLRALVGSDVAQDLFSAANKEYLRGRFEQARKNLQRLIELNPRDVEARLLLTTIGLREGQVEECDGQLRRLQRLSSAAKWSAEIRQQWQQLERLRQKIHDGQERN